MIFIPVNKKRQFLKKNQRFPKPNYSRFLLEPLFKYLPRNKAIVTAEHLKENECQCSFCRKWQGEVELMIAGPAGAFICCECIDRCVDAVKDFRDIRKRIRFIAAIVVPLFSSPRTSQATTIFMQGFLPVDL